MSRSNLRTPVLAKDSAACVADAVEEYHGPQPPRLSKYDEDRTDAMLKDGSLKVITSTIELELRSRRVASLSG